MTEKPQYLAMDLGEKPSFTVMKINARLLAPHAGIAVSGGKVIATQDMDGKWSNVSEDK